MPRRPHTVVFAGLSLDGCIARRGGRAPEDLGQACLEAVDALVIDGPSLAWAAGLARWPFAGTPLTVLGAVPETLRARAEASSLEPAALLTALARAGARRVGVEGAEAARAFLAADLVDELVLVRLPLLLGDGERLFGRLDRALAWEHVGTTCFEDGPVESVYRRLRE